MPRPRAPRRVDLHGDSWSRDELTTGHFPLARCISHSARSAAYGGVLSDWPTEEEWRSAPNRPGLLRNEQSGYAATSLAATISAICTALSAAPLRRLSLLMKSASPRSSGTPGSCLMRP